MFSGQSRGGASFCFVTTRSLNLKQEEVEAPLLGSGLGIEIAHCAVLDKLCDLVLGTQEL